MKTHYQVLELPEQASADDIRRAYLRLVRLTHPDRTPDPAAHARYLLVNEAYDTLREPARRAHYDAQLRAAAAPPPPERPVPPFPGNAYQVLRVPYSASATHIEQAYQRLSRQLRRNTVDPALRRYLAEVEHAYATLCSPQARQQHDARVRGQRPARRFDWVTAVYIKYAPPIRRICRWLPLLPLLVWLDYWLPGRTVLARPLLLQCQSYRGFYSCQVRTTEGFFQTSADLPGDIEYYRMQLSWLFRFVHEVSLPSGEVLPLLSSPATLAGCSVLLVLLAALTQWRRLSAVAVVNLAVVVGMLTLLVLLMAIFNTH